MPDEPVLTPDPAAPAAVADTPAPVAEAPAPAPWSKDIEERFPDAAQRAAVDAYLREKQQPYITQLEARATEAEGKAWVFDALNGDDPATALRDIAEQVYDADIASKVDALLRGGADPEAVAAAAAAKQEERDAAPDVIDLDKLSPEVREAVEYARTAKERDAAAEAARIEQEEAAAATKLYDEWRADLLAEQPDIKESALHRYVVGAEGDMEQGLADYRADFPAPVVAAPAPSATLGGTTTGGIAPSRPSTGSVGDAFGEVFDAARGTITL